MASCSSTEIASSCNIVKKVLVDVQQEGQFALETPRAILAKQAAQFIITAEDSVVEVFYHQQFLRL